ncbi:hypothetical protein FIBSPDRAFT_203169 [Athelia psychrophila]|uniref:WW domain-containing protein n=1 Tax=Athelia psychrophila TaxID=1759441 RepID=A0A165ZFQ5_9AGAM|nr:hypothetical protein FIBSPDRAFT_203169 [Fibularhizoctonia sp. CBS 109695]
MSDLPLPYGWIQEMDQTHGHPYWVDTKANPPRSIWTHPYEDEQYLNENPAVREKVQNKRHSQPDLPGLAPPGDSKSGDPRRHSFSGSQSGIQAGASGAASSSTANDRDAAGKKGFFGKLKDKAIGTKEEREAYKKQQMELDRQRAIQRQRQMEAYQAQMAQMRQQRQQQGRPFGGGMYSSPAGNPYQMGGSGGFGGGGFGGGMNGRRRQGGGFGERCITR